MKSASETIARSHNISKSYQITPHNILNHRIHHSLLEIWQPSSEDVLKVNVDASVHASFDHFGIGLVGRDMRGHVVFAEGKTIPWKFTPLYAELFAIKEGILWALKSGWTTCIIESDALAAVQGLLVQAPYSVEAPLTAEIRLLVLHLLPYQSSTALGAPMQWHIIWRVDVDDAIPLFLGSFVKNDLMY